MVASSICPVNFKSCIQTAAQMNMYVDCEIVSPPHRWFVVKM